MDRNLIRNDRELYTFLKPFLMAPTPTISPTTRNGADDESHRRTYNNYCYFYFAVLIVGQVQDRNLHDLIESTAWNQHLEVSKMERDQLQT